MPEGRQSPPPERQTGAQQQAPPASGKGTDNAENKDKTLQAQLDNLTSNPAGPMDANLEDKYSKTQKSTAFRYST
ncbi:hypothetical protein S40293_00699 [Stachybotrys chartarum IBT 40293]|nr:hypothetical protein S40293_00699 [Stachybotrys chartarum IBT 40293]